MAEKSVMGSEGQITIPKSMREKYHLLEGEEVVLVAREEGVLVKHCPSSLRGRLKGNVDVAGFEGDIRGYGRNGSRYPPTGPVSAPENPGHDPGHSIPSQSRSIAE